MKAYYCDHFVLPLPPEHRFPMAKYRLLRERVAAELVPPVQLLEPPAATDAEILRCHDAAYLERVKSGLLTSKEIRKIGFPWSPYLVERSRRSVGGTLAAARSALADGVSVNLAGGTHHAQAGEGQGYCVLNDTAIAARAMQAEGRIRRALIVDCDVHQGNGTAVIFVDDPSVFTFSIHGEKNFPFHKATSDLDIGLPDGVGDAGYLDALATGMRAALDSARPDLIFYLAGADPFAGDTLGRLCLSKDGLLARDRLVLEAGQQAGLPLVVVMAGGYARDVQDIVDIHFQTVREVLLNRSF